MKKWLPLALSLLLVLCLTACTGKPKEDSARVKCPACGYEFAVPHGK